MKTVKLSGCLMAACAAALLWASPANAQLDATEFGSPCCASICLSAAESGCPDECDPAAAETPKKSRRCTHWSDDVEGMNPPSGPGYAGCGDLPGGVCVGGNGQFGFAVPTGCAGANGMYYTGQTSPSPSSAAQCTAAAVAGCTLGGKKIDEPSSDVCGFCPSLDPDGPDCQP